MRMLWARSLRPAVPAVTVTVLLAGLALPVVAAPLTPEQCTPLQAEHGALVAAGVPEHLKKGPAWAKANLPAGKLREVDRYIELQEQLLFRCGLAKLRDLPNADGEEVADPAAPVAASAAAAATAPVKPLQKPREKTRPRPLSDEAGTKSPAAIKAATNPAQPAAKPAPKSPAKSEPQAAAPPKPKPKPAPKPKVDDAFRPPPKAPTPQD